MLLIRTKKISDKNENVAHPRKTILWSVTSANWISQRFLSIMDVETTIIIYIYTTNVESFEVTIWFLLHPSFSTALRRPRRPEYKFPIEQLLPQNKLIGLQKYISFLKEITGNIFSRKANSLAFCQWYFKYDIHVICCFFFKNRHKNEDNLVRFLICWCWKMILFLKSNLKLRFPRKTTGSEQNSSQSCSIGILWEGETSFS